MEYVGRRMIAGDIRWTVGRIDPSDGKDFDEKITNEYGYPSEYLGKGTCRMEHEYYLTDTFFTLMKTRQLLPAGRKAT